MKHEDIQDLLEAYVDDRLDRPTRKLVDDHLKDCHECRAILDEVAPVDIAVLGAGRFDERVMRRTVRRSLFRTAINTALLLLMGFMVVWLLSVLVVQPFLVNRGGRAADTAQAAIDLTSMVNPGAVLVDGEIQSGIMSRTLTLEYVLPVGGSTRDLGIKSIRIGILDVGDVNQGGGQLWPFFDNEPLTGEASSILGELGDGTVATVLLSYQDALTVDEAQDIADDTGYDVRTVWAGFDASLGQFDFPYWTAGGVLGYATCQTPSGLNFDEILGATSASFSMSHGSSPASISGALMSVIDGLTNIADQPGVLNDLNRGADKAVNDVTAILTSLQTDPSVKTLVITGPSSELSRFLDDHESFGSSAQVLAIDFYNWASGICGR